MAFNDIVVKDETGNDVTYVAMSPAAGDGIWAEYRASGPSPAFSASLRMRTSWNSKRNTRRLEIAGSYPVSVVKDGIRTLLANVPFRTEMSVPQFLEETDIARAVTVQLNAVASQAAVDSGKTGYAPRG